MTTPITATSPVSALITIQPVATATAISSDTPDAQQLIALLSDGSIVRGFVINRDAQNNPIIRTQSGDFVVKSDVFIKTGSEITLRGDNAHPNSARILSIDHLTPEDYSAQNIRGLAEDTVEASPFKTLGNAVRTSATGQPVATSALPVLPAVVLQALTPKLPEAAPAQPAAATSPAPNFVSTTPAATAAAPTIPAALSQLPAGTPLRITVFDVVLPPVPISLASIPASNAVSSLLPAAPPPNNAPTPAPSAPLPSAINAPLAAAFLAFEKAAPPPRMPTATNNPFTTNTTPATPPVPVVNQPAAAQATLPTTHAPSAPVAIPAPTQSTATAAQPIFQGQIIGHGEDGSAILHTPFASLKLYTTQPLPTGTTLALAAEVDTAPVANTIPFFANLPAQPTTTPAPSFSYLAPALSMLSTLDPAIARAFTQQLPVIGPRLTSGLLFFLAAVKTGERRGMMNYQDISRLEAAAPNLLSQLSKDIRELNQQFTNPRLEDWKPIQLPLIFGQNVETAQLYIRKEPEDSSGKIEKLGAGNRFLLDLNLSQLGPLQLDGFVRSGERGKSLELFLRSAEPLDATISQDIRDLFVNATQATGLKGNLVFQQGAEHFVTPEQKSPPSTEGAHTILA